jgi:hypothetical protein
MSDTGTRSRLSDYDRALIDDVTSGLDRLGAAVAYRPRLDRQLIIGEIVAAAARLRTMTIWGGELG